MDLCRCLLLLPALPVGRSAGSVTEFSLAGSTKAPDGSPWTLHNHNGSISIPATIPGVVHLDLLRAHRVAEPYYR